MKPSLDPDTHIEINAALKAFDPDAVGIPKDPEAPGISEMPIHHIDGLDNMVMDLKMQFPIENEFGDVAREASPFVKSPSTRVMIGQRGLGVSIGGLYGA